MPLKSLNQSNIDQYNQINVAQLVGAVKYTNCISAEG